MEQIENDYKPMKRVCDIISVSEVDKWNKNKIVLISAGTGTGKSTFVRETLEKYCKENNKKILVLVNRIALKNQTQKAVEDKKKTANIRITSYQSLIKILRRHGTIPKFDFVICDESHFFFSDCLFNNTTDIAWNWIINGDFIKIFMSATPDIPKRYIKKVLGKKHIEYKLPLDYNKFIKEINIYENQKVIEKVLFDLPEGEKAIYFSSAKKAYNMSIALKDAKFYCSQSNEHYYEYSDQETFKNICENEKFDCKVLCTTSAMDNGINFNDVRLIHVIIDYLDVDEIIQMIGRKRLLENDDNQIVLYIRNRNKGSLMYVLNGLEEKLEPAQYLIENGENDFTSHYYKKQYDRKIIDTINGSDGQIHHLVNQMAYTKLTNQLEVINKMLKYKKDGFMKYIRKILKYTGNSIFLDIVYDKFTLQNYLDSKVGIEMYKNERKAFKEFLTNHDFLFNPIKTDHGRVGYNQINGFFEDKKLPYVITSDIQNSRQNENYKKTFWTLSPICSNTGV